MFQPGKQPRNTSKIRGYIETELKQVDQDRVSYKFIHKGNSSREEKNDHTIDFHLAGTPGQSLETVWVEGIISVVTFPQNRNVHE